MPVETVRLNIKECARGSRLTAEMRAFDDSERDRAREAYWRAHERAHHDAYMAVLMLQVCDTTGITWLLLIKRRLQRAAAGVLRRLANRLEPRRVR